MVTNVSPESGAKHRRVDDLQEAIRQRAKEIYERSGKIPNRDTENWMQAEDEIRREASQPAERRTAVVVKVDGIEYVGEYSLAAGDDYAPGEFSAGDAVEVRFEQDKMYVQRHNGKELETRIVKKYS